MSDITLTNEPILSPLSVLPFLGWLSILYVCDATNTEFVNASTLLDLLSHSE